MPACDNADRCTQANAAAEILMEKGSSLASWTKQLEPSALDVGKPETKNRGRDFWRSIPSKRTAVGRMGSSEKSSWNKLLLNPGWLEGTGSITGSRLDLSPAIYRR